MNQFFLVSLLQLIASLFSPAVQENVPGLVTPVYTRLKEMNYEIMLVKDNKPACAIITPDIYLRDAERLSSAIRQRTGVRIPVLSDTDAAASTPFRTNLIILGNRSTSKISNELYDKYYSLADLKFPGPGGFAVRSLHDPYGNGYSAILIGGSDNEGVSSGADAFIRHLESLRFSSGNFAAGWTILTRLGEGISIPSDLRDFETWEASKGYGSVGYFGWNSISKRMAMYYMTGDPFHAREAIRLSFPDVQALKEIDEIDGERIENKKDPLAGPYHYNALMLILFWDLIEESPVFTDEERLKVTNAFARRFEHEGTTPFDKKTYTRTSVPEYVGSRHDQWSALSVYTLARYFNKYYPSAMWAQAERAGVLSFGSLHSHSYVQGEMDQLTWYCTGIAPVLTYMVLTGDRKPLENGVLGELLRGQEVLLTGNNPEWALNSAALDFLNKAAYLTGDGRWITYRNRTGMDTGMFRLGQSFWPDTNIKPALPTDLAGKWTVKTMSQHMHERRQVSFPADQSFEQMSYRNKADSSGDFILLKGYNGAYRNPYHTFSILELRIDGETILKGFNNQVLSSADGMVEPAVAMDAALLFHDVTGEVAAACARVPDLPYLDLKRTILHRTGKYVVIADDLTFRNTSAQPEISARVEINWELAAAEWMPDRNLLRINPQKNTGYEIHPSAVMNFRKSGGRNSNVASMIWSHPVKNGQKMTFFHLIGRNSPGKNGALASLRLTDNAAAMMLPEPGLAVTGKYLGTDAELALLSGKNIYGHNIVRAGLKNTILETDQPVDLDWELQTGRMDLVSTKNTRIKLNTSSKTINLDGKTVNGQKVNGTWLYIIPAGRHKLEGISIPAAEISSIAEELNSLISKAGETRGKELASGAGAEFIKAPELPVVLKSGIPGTPAEGIVIHSDKGDILCTPSGKTITLTDNKGSLVRLLNVKGNVRVLNWWEEHRLLLAGCDNEEVVAFDENGIEKWTFISVMDPAVYEAGKPYWFKSAYPGIYGVHSGMFDNGKSRAFVGSACTVEIIDENGKLVKRLPVFWGPGRQFLMSDAPDGSRNLMIGRYGNDWVTLAVINSRTMSETGRGYNGVPQGHTFVNGWDAMNRYDNFITDLDGDGKKEVVSAINGTWNRISVYSLEGKPLYNAQFGPGVRGPRTNMRMMDVGDIDGDGMQEIVAAISAGFVNALNSKTEKLWARQLPSPPSVVKIIRDAAGTWICAGCDDGSVFALDGKGNILRMNRVNGKPVDIQLMKTSEGTAAVIVTDIGEIRGFRMK